MVAFYLPGGVPIYTFALLLGGAASLGLAWAALNSRRKQVIPVLNAGLSALAGGIVGGWLAYEAANLGYFRTHGLEAAHIYSGGLAWPGTLAGGLLGLGLYAWLSGYPLGALADRLIPLGALVAASAWIACWLDGCAYGVVSRVWWALPAQDEWGVWEHRVPVQLIGALLTLGIAWFVEWLRPRLQFPGQAALLALLLFSLMMFALSWLRQDATPLAGGLRLEAWCARIFAGLFGGALLATIWGERKRSMYGKTQS